MAGLHLKPVAFPALLERGLSALPLGWLLGTPCPLCRKLPPLSEGGATAFCRACEARLLLPPEGLQGQLPLSWWSSGNYGGALREVLLELKRHPSWAPLRCWCPSPAGKNAAILYHQRSAAA